MHISARHDYAMQAMLAIAAAGGRLVNTNELAALQGIPATYLPPLLYDLRRAELLSSRPGNVGGYSLARGADRITVGDVMRAVSGELSSIRGRPAQSVSYVGAARALPRLWRSVHSLTAELLDGITLRDLLDELPESTAGR
ncbi:Rrf2 family transcriptional regulator [Catellatospora sp. IY07-71]|uniref:RrF2 family transcriptional regulator n=1 Tax=Catellatospora sp. IY07-71 TaxID=2728827 RepID=UPI001BB39AA7|nr:Rrf2 family transcriptional regulator [Catellatospora sp. IY07-71]BCJ76500.1 Rrf2 family transcriptional regulator [Catellatospora sp. IY07-71]